MQCVYNVHLVFKYDIVVMTIGYNNQKVIEEIVKVKERHTVYRILLYLWDYTFSDMRETF
jgi:hypothetical protein